MDHTSEHAAQRKRRCDTKRVGLVKTVQWLVRRLRDNEPRVVHHTDGRLLSVQYAPRRRYGNQSLSTQHDTPAELTVCRQKTSCNRQDLSLNQRDEFRRCSNYRAGVD